MNDQISDDQFLDDISEIIDLVREGETDDALGLIQSCLPKYPDSTELLLLTSVCSFQQGDIGRAIELCEVAHKTDPDGQEIVDSLAVLHALVGNHSKAIYYAKLATTLIPHPDIPDLLPNEFANFFEALSVSRPSQHYLNGLFSYNAREFSDAVTDFERELRINPENIQAIKMLGKALVRKGSPSEALKILDVYSERLPGDAEVMALKALAHCQLAEFEATVQLCQQAMKADSDSINVAMLVLESSMYFNDENAAAHSEFVEALNTRVLGQIDEDDLNGVPRTRGTDEPISIAIVSNSLFDSELAHFLRPIYEHIDKSKFTITTYQQSPTGGSVFSELKSRSENWRRIVDMDDDVVNLILERSNTDIVIDMCGLSENGRAGLFAMSQHRIVTSLSCMPYGDDLKHVNLVISDAVTAEHDKASLRGHQTNIDLSSGLVAMDEPRLMGDVQELPARRNEHITFGGTASLKHLSAETVAMWASILEAIPNAKLHLGYVRNATQDVKERARALFADAGLSDRVSVWNTDYDQRANPTYFNQIDVFLDSYPVSNPLNVCHALWLGVPVISLKGDTRRSMMGACTLSAAGKAQWIANSIDEAVSIAKELTEDTASLEQTRQTLRDEIKASALLDAKGYVRALEDVFEKSLESRSGV